MNFFSQRRFEMGAHAQYIPTAQLGLSELYCPHSKLGHYQSKEQICPDPLDEYRMECRLPALRCMRICGR
jgi:hypothetical protein